MAMSMHKFRKQSLPPELENISQDELEEFREAFRLFDKVSNSINTDELLIQYTVIQD